MKFFKWILPAFILTVILLGSQSANAITICNYDDTEKYELYDAIRYKGDNLAFIKFCCTELGACVNGYEGKEGYNLTHAAAKYKRYEVLKYLVEERNIPVEKWRFDDKLGWVKDYTQLMEAAKNGDLKISQYLISKGASITLKNQWGKDAKYYAENAEHKDPGFLTYMRAAWNKAMGLAEAKIKANKDNLLKVIAAQDITQNAQAFTSATLPNLPKAHVAGVAPDAAKSNVFVRS